MSAFLVDNDVINQALAYFRKAENDPMSRWTVEALESFGFNYNLLTDEGLSALGQSMFDLNVRGIEARYNPEQVEYLVDSSVYQFSDGFRPTRVEALKCLICFLYQCMEGDIPEDSKFYLALQEVSNRIAHDIVRDLPEYEALPWGG
jgi:hypothetical protein